jgi:periplasmic protein TonB
MNNAFEMDRSDKVGLGAALGGHVLLLALLLFGLLRAAEPMGADGGGSGDGVAVEIVSEAAPSAEAPAPVEEAVEEVQEAPPEPVPEAVFDPAPVPKPVERTVPKPAAVTKPTPKPVTKPVAKTVPKPPVKPQAKPVKAGTGRSNAPSDFDKQMEKRLGGLGGGTGATKTKGPGAGTGKGATTQTAAQIRSLASNAIAAEVRPFIPGCAPPTSDNSSLRVFVQLNIGSNAALVGANVYDVQGITPSNQAQVEAMKRCVLDSLRKASPYNLDPDQYDTWRNHKVQLKVNFK